MDLGLLVFVLFCGAIALLIVAKKLWDKVIVKIRQEITASLVSVKEDIESLKASKSQLEGRIDILERSNTSLTERVDALEKVDWVVKKVPAPKEDVKKPEKDSKKRDGQTGSES